MTESKVCRSGIPPGMLTRSLRFFFILLIVSLCCPTGITAQGEQEYYEISVNLDIKRVGGTEIDAVIKSKDIYLSVADLFNFLKIKNTLSPEMESVKGFFISQNARYEIDRYNNRIIYRDKTFDLKEGDLVLTESDLYLKSSYFGEIFGLNCIFNFRSLSVTVETQLEVPLIREMRQEEIRRNLGRLKAGETEADTIFDRTYPVFKFGMADWSAIVTEQIGGRTDARLNLTLGSMIAGGEATASINYDSRQAFTEKQQHYLWRYVNNDHNLLRQVKLGKIPTYSHSTIFNPVVGAQITNTPTSFRRSFGTYTLSDRTEPGWIVELYVNNVLVDYVKADASGFFTFEVPLVYGNTMVKLKFFGPWGEEHTREQNINIPFNYLPSGTMEYTISAGIVEDGTASKFGRADINYGLSKRITVGAGLEYLSSVSSGPLMPYLKSSLRITNNLLLTGEYVHGVKAGGALTYRLPSNLQFDIKYNNYDKDQEAIYYNYLEERKATISLPLRIGNFSSYNRFSINQLVLPSSKYTTGEWLFSGSVFGVSTNLTTYALFIEEADPYVYSNLSLALRLPWRLTLMPQAQYGYTQKSFLSAKLKIEKILLDHAFLNLSFERDLRSNMNLAELGLRYNFSFAQTGASARHSGEVTTLVQYARGSLINDSESHYFRADNKPNVGKGGIIIKPFLDYNANGRRDSGEVAAPGLNLRSNGGTVDKSEKDTTIAIIGLEPYTSCFIELDPSSFYNIAWRLPYESLNVKVDPNILKNIEIPVQVVGEAAGFVKTERDGTSRGLGRVIVRYYNDNNRLIASTLTEADGYYSYFGLSPGRYFVMVDTAQLNSLGMEVDPDTLGFEIEQSIDGDIVGDLNFTLNYLPSDTVSTDTVGKPEPVIKVDSTYMIVHEVVEELITITEDSWAIQLGAFSQKSNADRMRATLERLLGKAVEIVIEDPYYKVRILELKDREEVDRNLEVLNRLGFNEFWVIRLKAMQQQMILKEVEDSVLQVTETVIGGELPVVLPEMSIQIGAFRNEDYAKALVDKLSFTLGKKLVIVREDGFHKVRVTGFDSAEDMEKTIPALGILGVDDIWVIPVEQVAVDTTGAVREEVEVPDDIGQIDLETIKPDTTLKKEDLKFNEPQFSLQVAVYAKRTQAMRAKRKIENRLNLPVEIVQQWDYYRVIVTGFFTPEETYRYYPELAGLGFDSIILIDNSK